MMLKQMTDGRPAGKRSSEMVEAGTPRPRRRAWDTSRSGFIVAQASVQSCDLVQILVVVAMNLLSNTED